MKLDTVNNKKKNPVRRFLLILLAIIIFNVFTFPLYMCYGPFKKVRNIFVTTAMATGNHQYFAKIFFSDNAIAEIQKEYNANLNLASSNLSNYTKVEIKDDGSAIKMIKVSDNATALIIKDKTKVKVGYTSKLDVAGEKVSEMAGRYNAIAAINGGGYTDTSPSKKTGGTGGTATGIVISDGKVIWPKNTSEYNTPYMLFSLDQEGNMFVGSASVNQLLKKNVKQAVSFDPALIRNGKGPISQSTLTGLNPRTAIGQMSDGRIIFLTVDGRSGLSLGSSLEEVQKMMYQLGAVNAICLDGGGSTTMYLNNEIINTPSCVTGERALPDIIYVEP